MPERLIGLFSTDPSVLSVGTSLLLLAAVFQLFDGIQGVITGTLRGLGDTRTPMIVNLVAHWLLGLPVSYLLCFVARLGRVGIVDRPVAGLDRHRRDFVLGVDGEDRTLCAVVVNDAHVHFFSPSFFAGLGADRERHHQARLGVSGVRSTRSARAGSPSSTSTACREPH